jgi:nucleotide-binding universal stress UspA family protein
MHRSGRRKVDENPSKVRPRRARNGACNAEAKAMSLPSNRESVEQGVSAAQTAARAVTAMALPDETIGSVLVATDFSKGAELALARAVRLPLAKAARIHIVHVVSPKVPDKARPKAKTHATRALEKYVARAQRETSGRNVTVTSEVRIGEPFTEIIRLSRSLNVDLIVLGRHGRRAIRDMFIGTTAERVIRHGDVPVLVVNLKATHPYRHPVIATDLEDSCGRTLDLALRVLGTHVKLVDVVHAFHVPFEGFVTPSNSARGQSEWRRSYQEKAATGLTKMLASYQKVDVRWKPFVRHGDPRTVILAAAARRKADLIAIGTHGRSGIAHALVGSVAEWIITAAPCDVLVTRPIRFSFELP